MRGYTVVFMNTGLIWFRAPNWDTAMEVFRAFGRGGSAWSPTDWGLTVNEWHLALGLFVFAQAVDVLLDWKPQIQGAFFEGHGLKRWAVSWLLLVGLILLGAYGVNIQDEAFIYFQF